MSVKQKPSKPGRVKYGLPFKQESCQPSHSDSVETGFRWILILGQVLGLSPISVPLKREHRGNLRFQWRSLSTAHSLFLASIIFGAFMFELSTYVSNIGSYQTILDEMSALELPLYNLTLFCLFAYWLWNASALLRLFQNWSVTMNKIGLNKEDKRFPRFCLKIMLIVSVTCVAEIMLYNVHHIQAEGTYFVGDNLIERLYKNTLGHLQNFIPYYSPLTAIPFIFAYKVGYYCSNYSSIFVIVFCHALAIKFSLIHKEIQISLNDLEDETNRKIESVKPTPNSEQRAVQISVMEQRNNNGREHRERETVWKEIREKILALCGLAKEVAGFVAPLVLACYVYSIFFVMLNSIRFLYESNIGTSPYVYVSTLQHAMRVVLVTYYASQVYHSTDKLLESLEYYPDSIFCPTAYRLERMLGRHPIGVTLLGSVVITRNVFISILSFLFTVEIVLLQAMGAVVSANSRQMEEETNCYLSACIRNILSKLKLEGEGECQTVVIH